MPIIGIMDRVTLNCNPKVFFLKEWTAHNAIPQSSRQRLSSTPRSTKQMHKKHARLLRQQAKWLIRSLTTRKKIPTASMRSRLDTGRPECSHRTPQYASPALVIRNEQTIIICKSSGDDSPSAMASKQAGRQSVSNMRARIHLTNTYTY